MKYLNDIFDDSELLRSKRVLVCDDEADFASRNYLRRKGEVDLLRMAELIEKFRKKPAFCRYLQITATPYSLFLQPDGTVKLRGGKEASSWLPRYTGFVPVHEMYVGGREYFELSEDENSMYSCLFQPVNETCVNVLSERNDWYSDSPIHSETLSPLNFAVVSYLFATAVRIIQRRKKENQKYRSSCLIHCEVEKDKHDWQDNLLRGIMDDLKKAFLYQHNSDLYVLDFEKNAYDSLKLSNELGNQSGLICEDFPTFAEVETEVKRILEDNAYTIQTVNSDDDVPAMLNKKGQLSLEGVANIFIGGNILDRGITIDNMLCFFYGRDPQKFQMDTVLQHARMYGARIKEDMACTRFFTTEKIYDVLKSINNIDTAMYDYLKFHQNEVQSNDFLTSMVINYDPRIKATASNKYTPANTKVLKPFMRILPKGFQTGTMKEIGKTIKEIDDMLAKIPAYKEVTDKNPFFLMDCDTAQKIIGLISSTFVYAEEWKNLDYQWDPNEMFTALEHSCFDNDGKIYCQVCTNRNMSRERSNINDPRGRFIDAPESGATNALAKTQAENRPVLTLLRQNGLKENGWRDTPFYWPVLLLNGNLEACIFTINDKKKIRKLKPEIALDTLGNYPPKDVLHLTLHREFFFAMLEGRKKWEVRLIQPSNAAFFVKTDGKGGYIRIKGLDSKPGKHYTLKSLNNGVFPFELKQFKYIHFRTSMDMSGSQMLIKLDEETPYSLNLFPITSKDIRYNEMREGTLVEDYEQCEWRLYYHLSDVLEYKISEDDKEAYEAYRQELAEVECDGERSTGDDFADTTSMQDEPRVVERIRKTSVREKKTDTGRALPFKFHMVGLEAGDTVVFDALNLPVTVASDSEVEYEGKRYSLSSFTSEFLPKEKQNTSGAYQGPKFFSYNGKTLAKLRKEKEK